MKPEWTIDIRNQRVAARVPFIFKQWGGRTPKLAEDGRVYYRTSFLSETPPAQLELQARA